MVFISPVKCICMEHKTVYIVREPTAQALFFFFFFSFFVEMGLLCVHFPSQIYMHRIQNHSYRQRIHETVLFCLLWVLLQNIAELVMSHIQSLDTKEPQFSSVQEYLATVLSSRGNSAILRTTPNDRRNGYLLPLTGSEWFAALVYIRWYTTVLFLRACSNTNDNDMELFMALRLQCDSQ